VAAGTLMKSRTSKKVSQKKPEDQTQEVLVVQEAQPALSPSQKEILDLEFKLTKLRELVNYLRVELAKERKKNEHISES